MTSGCGPAYLLIASALKIAPVFSAGTLAARTEIRFLKASLSSVSLEHVYIGADASMNRLRDMVVIARCRIKCLLRRDSIQNSTYKQRHTTARVKLDDSGAAARRCFATYR